MTTHNARLGDWVIYTRSGTAYRLTIAERHGNDNNISITLMAGSYSKHLPLANLCTRLLYTGGYR